MALRPAGWAESGSEWNSLPEMEKTSQGLLGLEAKRLRCK
jgi:hypothetical protein